MEHLSPDHLYEVVDRTVIVVLRRPPTTAVLNAVEARVQGLARSQRGKFAYLHVVLDVPTTGRLDDETRTVFMATARRVLPHLEGAAMILMGDGFRVAAMRAAVSGGLMLLRPASPVRIYATVDEGARWLSTLGSRDAERLSRATAELSAVLLEDYAPTS